MIEVTGNLWSHPADVRVITTNGTINSRGEAVMGRGCAKEAALKFPQLPKQLAARIRAEGNHPYAFPEYGLMTFPVKHQWFERANLELIRTSALQLTRMLDPGKVYCLARPGCGNGKRSWREVKPLLNCLPDNVHVIDFPPPLVISQSSLPTAA